MKKNMTVSEFLHEGEGKQAKTLNVVRRRSKPANQVRMVTTQLEEQAAPARKRTFKGLRPRGSKGTRERVERKHISLNSRWIAAVCATLLVGGTAGYVYLGPLLSGQADQASSNPNIGQQTLLDETQPSLSGDFFKDYRAERERARTAEIELLDSIVNQAGADTQSVQDAQTRKIDITTYNEAERAIEKVLIAKGFEDAIAFIQSGTLSIVIKQEKLSDEDVARILEVAQRESGLEAKDIKLIPTK